MKFSKLKSMLGFCTCKGCFRRAVVDIEISKINHKGCLCDKHYDEILENLHEEEIRREFLKGKSLIH